MASSENEGAKRDLAAHGCCAFVTNGTHHRALILCGVLAAIDDLVFIVRNAPAQHLAAGESKLVQHKIVPREHAIRLHFLRGVVVVPTNVEKRGEAGDTRPMLLNDANVQIVTVVAKAVVREKLSRIACRD